MPNFGGRWNIPGDRDDSGTEPHVQCGWRVTVLGVLARRVTDGVEGVIVGKALYSGVFTLPAALEVVQ